MGLLFTDKHGFFTDFHGLPDELIRVYPFLYLCESVLRLIFNKVLTISYSTLKSGDIQQKNHSEIWAKRLMDKKGAPVMGAPFLRGAKAAVREDYFLPSRIFSASLR